MMEINIHSREQEFHRFSTDDFALIEIGLGSYTISSLTNFLDGMSPDFRTFFTQASSATLINKLIGEDYKGTMKINAFNLTEKKYELITGLSRQADEPSIVSLDPEKFPASNFIAPRPVSVSFLLNKWNEIQRGTFSGTPQQLNGYKAVAYKIQNSSSGCITFNATFNILGSSRNSLIRLHLLESSDAESSRSISFKGSPIFTAPPQTAYGVTWGYRNTTSSDPGAYFSPSQGGADNPENTVSAPMDMAFDPSVGKWQSGTQQVLMRLLDNVDPAIVPNVNPQELQSATRSQVYDDGDESPFRIKFSGPYKAIPMSSENGNPYLFGPDYKDGCVGTNQAILQVINRLNIAYKAGSIVVCSKMLGDSGLWTIVGGVGQEAGETEKTTAFRNFEYQQYIIGANLYFTIPTNGSRILPETLSSKARLDYYLKLLNLTGNTSINGGAGSNSRLFTDIVWLNLAASNLNTSNTSDAIQQLKILYNSIRSQGGQLSSDSKIDGVGALTFIKNNYCNSESTMCYQSIPTANESDPLFALPKNIQKYSAKTTSISLPLVSSFGDFVTAAQVPVFWGMLFPDGYKSDSVRSFQSFLGTFDIYRDDPNLSELTCGATECVYDFRDKQKNLRFATSLGLPPVNSNLFVRKTGGLVRQLKNLSSVIDDPISLLGYVNITNNGGFYSERMKSVAPTPTIYGAEPVNPGRIQFSSMSIDSMYFASSVPDFGLLDRRISDEGFLNTTAIFSNGQSSSNYKNYAKALLYPDRQNATFSGTSVVDSRNKYNIQALNLANAVNRHFSAIGTLSDLGLPEIGNPLKVRVPAIPVLTCKSTVITSSPSLSFTCDQSIGVNARRTVAGGGGGNVQIIGGNLVVTPSNGPLSFESVQWGGGNDIDSLGTTALHVRVFEHVPPNQLIYIGPLFTPLHFNPSEPLTDDEGEFNSFSTDFKVPTTVDGAPYGLNQPVTATSLASFDNWKINTVRRGKMTTGGGFAYFKSVILATSATPVNRGSGYKDNEILKLSDGSEIIIISVRDIGEIKGVINRYEFKPNFEGDYTKTSTNGFRSVENISIAGGSGRDAKFTFTFIIKYDIGYDPAPKESTSPRGLLISSSNNRGASEHITNQSRVSVELVKTNNNTSFDIFYFYHNDPSHYSLYENLSNGAAQYIISEVKGQ